MSIERGVEKEDVIPTDTDTDTHTMEYYSAIKKNEIMPSEETWIDLEIVRLSEVRQRKTNIIQYCSYVESKKGYK